MELLFNVLSLIGQAFIRVLASPFFWLVVGLIWLQYRKLNKNKETLFGVSHPILPSVLVALAYGVIGGVIGSFLMVIFGVSVSGLGIGYLWLIAVVLMLFNPRFLCFAYAGGLLALFSLVTGFPALDIPSLMALVAILHLVESLLILFTGHFDPFPVSIRSLSGRVVGGFNLQKFWPIPLVLMATLVSPSPEVLHGVMQMPDWWPLIKPWEKWGSTEVVYGMIPVVAALGYGEFVLTSSPRQKAKHSALNLFFYSLLLLGLAVLASYIPQLAVLPALFSPLGHEAVIFWGHKKEFQGKPIFVTPSRGVMILDVIIGSTAAKAGLRSGDIILEAGGFLVNSRFELEQTLANAGSSLEITYLSSDKQMKKIVIDQDPNKPLGIITVPEPGDPANVQYSGGKLLKKLWRYFQ